MQNKKIKAVIVGFAHMHVNEIALYINEQPDIDLAGGADIKPKIPEISEARYTRAWNIKNVSGSYGMPVYEEYTKMLDELKPDVAFILAENAKKPDAVEECAKRGIDVVIEKPLAVSLAEAKKIKKCVDTYGIRAFVNWPTTWRPYIYKMKNALDMKIAGDLIKMYYINGHTGPLGAGARHRGVSANAESMTDEERSKTWWYQAENGGGAFLDIGCYGFMYSRYVNKEKAISVMAHSANLNTPCSKAEDNVASIIKYPSTMSVVEATWTTPQIFIPSGPVLYCKNGIIYCTKENGIPDVKAMDIFGNDIEVPEIEYPEHMKNIAWEYAYHIKTGEPVHETLPLERNIEVMALLDTAIRSSKSRKEEMVP